jgi:hypothetical protein
MVIIAFKKNKLDWRTSAEGKERVAVEMGEG